MTRGVIALLAGLVIGGACWLWLGGQRGSPSDAGPPGPIREAPDQKPKPRSDPQRESVAGVVLRLFDAETKAPAPGVRAFDTVSGRDVSTSDAEGRLELGTAHPRRVILHGDGWLAAILPPAAVADLAAHRPASSLVYRDRYSMPLDIATDWGERPEPPAAIRVGVVPEADEVEAIGFPTARLGPGESVSRELRAAWAQHTLLVQQVRDPGLVWHLGHDPVPHTMRARGGRIRFLDAMAFRLRARSGDGWVAAARAVIRPRTANRVVLEFRRGAVLRLHVVGRGRAAVAGATLRLTVPAVPREVLREASTDARGRAAFDGLFAAEEVEVAAFAAGYVETKARFRPGPDERVLTLATTRRFEHGFVVSERGSGKALAGVEALLGDPDRPASRARSGVGGHVRLELERGIDRVLSLRREGFIEYRELLSGVGVLPSRCEMIPADRARQLELRLVGAVTGVARGKDGKPAAGVRIALTPWSDSKGKVAADSIPAGGFARVQPGQNRRLVVAGLRAPDATDVISDEQGRFTLWNSSPGRAAVVQLGGKGGRREVFVVLGRKVEVRF